MSRKAGRGQKSISSFFTPVPQGADQKNRMGDTSRWDDPFGKVDCRNIDEL